MDESSTLSTSEEAGVMAAGSSPRSESFTLIWGTRVRPGVLSTYFHQLMLAFIAISGRMESDYYFKLK